MTHDWMEQVLETWGAWRSTLGMAEGWGGAVNSIERAGWAKSTPGAYADPVAAEYRRSEQQGHGTSALVNRLLAELDEKDRRVIFLRYVGERRVLSTKRIVSSGRIDISGHPGLAGSPVGRATIHAETEAPLHTGYSGRLPYARIAELTGLGDDAAARVVARVKKRLRTHLAMMAKVRKGQAGEVRRAA